MRQFTAGHSNVEVSAQRTKLSTRIRAGLLMVLAATALVACGSASGDGGSAGSKACASSSGSAAGRCTGRPDDCPVYASTADGTSPCGPIGCLLVLDFAGGADTCDGVAEDCDELTSSKLCVEQGCAWSGSVDECTSESGNNGEHEGGID